MLSRVIGNVSRVGMHSAGVHAALYGMLRIL